MSDKKRQKAIVLCSGGMDSVVALHYAAKLHEVVGVFSFHYGSKHNDKEIPMAQHNAHELGLQHFAIDLGGFAMHLKSDLLKTGGDVPDGHYEDDVMKQTVVPFRNGIMLSIAAGIAESYGAEIVIIAAHAGDHAIYPDCRASFMAAMRSAVKFGTYAGIELLAPFQHISKADIAAMGHSLAIDFRNTWSCYKGREKHCGRCGTCIERREAFHLAGVPDPTEYEDTAPSLAELIATGFKL